MQDSNQGSQTNLYRVNFEEIWVKRMCLLFKNIDFLFFVKSFGELLYWTTLLF